MVLSAKVLESSMAINNGNGSLTLRPLPVEAQFSPVYAISIDDYDDDGIKDILLAGNLFNAKPETGRYDASYGTFLKGVKNLEYNVDPYQEIWISN